jgi:hypothetical protein
MNQTVNQAIAIEVEAIEREIRDLREAIDDTSGEQATRLRYAMRSRQHRLDELRQGRGL